MRAHKPHGLGAALAAFGVGLICLSSASQLSDEITSTGLALGEEDVSKDKSHDILTMNQDKSLVVESPRNSVTRMNERLGEASMGGIFNRRAWF